MRLPQPYLATLTIGIFSMNSFAADTLADAFKEGKLAGEIKAEYSDSNFIGKTHSDDISAYGGSLNFITSDLYGLKAGITFQTSHIANSDTSGTVFQDDLDAQGAILSEAYLDYKISNTSLKVGRQYIYTPLVGTALDGKSSESILKDSFEGYVLTNTDLPSTTFVAGYVSKYQAKTNGLGQSGEFNTFQDGAYTVYVNNTSIENLTLQAQYLNENGMSSLADKNSFYVQADYALAGHTLSAQYLSSTDKTKATGAQDGQVFGLRATGGLGIGKLGYIAAYTSSMDDGAIYTGAGTGTSDTLFTAMPVNGGGVAARANTDTAVGGLIIPITSITTIAYAGESYSNDAGLGDVKAYGVIAIYPYDKNFLVKANYEHVATEHVFTENTGIVRVYLSYKF